MSFFIYENWQAGPHKVVIHHGSCGHCNDGTGRSRGNYDRSHGDWRGPFSSLDEARRTSASIPVAVHNECPCVGRFESNGQIAP